VGGELPPAPLVRGCLDYISWWRSVMDSNEKMVEMVREWIARGFAEDKKAGRDTAAEPDAAYILRCCYGLACRVKPDMTYTESCLGAQLAYSIKESFDEGLEGEEEGTMPDRGLVLPSI